MSARTKLFSRRALYDLEGTDELFVQAVRESLAFHLERCPEYAALLESRNFSAGSVRKIEDLWRIPPLPTLFLKRHSLFSIPEEKLPFRATSSGTSGVASRMGLDWKTAALALRMVLRTFSYYSLLSPRLTNYVVLGYQPDRSNRVGAVQTTYATTLLAPALHREYALKMTESGYEINLEGLLAALERYEKAGHPVRLLGFPAYFLFLLEAVEELGRPLRLPKGSKVFLAGGWKQFLTRQVKKEELYRRSEELLGIGGESCKEFFGAVEHPILYCDCKNHHFHVPIYSRVLLRDPDTLEPVGCGTPGLVNLISPLMGSMPFVSVMTDDLAVLHEGGECGCGISASWFEILGRVGLDAIKTCAAGAAELLKGGAP